MTYNRYPQPNNKEDLPLYVDDELSKLEDEINIIVIPEPWHEVGATGEPAFTNSWVNYSTPSYPAASFYKHLDRVYLTGLVKDGTVGAFAVFTLPEGYRPPNILHFPITSNGAYGTLVINATGTVQVTSGSNVWASLDGISFRI